MADRQLGDTLDTPGAIVVDFDGTVIAGNSLRWILRLGLKHLLRRLRLPSAIIVATLMLMRKLRLVSHETMKYGSLRVIGDDPALIEAMRLKVKSQCVDSVMSLIADSRSNGDTLLVATAASESYVHHLCRALGIGDNVIASPFGGPDLKGDRKRAAVSEWLAQRQLKIKAFVTDHPSDLPTARQAASEGADIYLVRPSHQALSPFTEASISPIILK